MMLTTNSCPDCEGSGELIGRQGFFTLKVPCSECEGTGVRKIRKPEDDLKAKLLDFENDLDEYEEDD